MHLNKAYQLAKSYTLVEMQAVILCKRGWLFYEQAYGSESVLDFDTAQKYSSWAKNDFLAAQQLEKKLYAGLRAFMQSGLGIASSRLASNSYELHQATREIQKIEEFIGKDRDEQDVYFLWQDEERYHLDLASVYVNAPVKMACYPRDARRALRNAAVARGNKPSKRLQAQETILTAKSYLLEGEYEEATKKSREALAQIKAIDVKGYLAYIRTFCNELSTTEYGKKSVDVGELEATLMTMQHPELFY